MSYTFCEVCKHRVYESKWDIHIEGEEHQRNVSKEKGRYWNGEALLKKDDLPRVILRTPEPLG